MNPEGFAEKFSFDFKTRVIKNFAVQGLQLLYNENNDLKFVNGNDSYAVGGQVSGRIELGPLTTTPSFTILNWRNPDAILNASAFAVQATTTGTPAGATTPVTGLPVPGEGPGCAKGSGLPATPPCVYGPQGFTNATLVDESGKVHFLSGFLYADFILNNQIKTGWKRLPVNLLLEYQNNLNAADHPLDSTGAATDLNKQSHAYLVDVSLGQSKAKNDLQFGYAWVGQSRIRRSHPSLRARTERRRTCCRTAFTCSGEYGRTPLPATTCGSAEPSTATFSTRFWHLGLCPELRNRGSGAINSTWCTRSKAD